jgi:hypothetical protein
MPDASNLSSNFTNLPMGQLISAPLVAAADANVRMAGATYDFINTVWIDSSGSGQSPSGGTTGGGTESGGSSGKTRVLQFDLNRKDNTGQDVNYKVNAPFASLVQTPNLMIQTVDVDFTMEVKDTVTTEDKSSSTGSFEGSANYLFCSVHITGSVSTSSSNTRTSDQSAKYDVKVHAEQARVTEGMNKLAQIFASVIEPVNLGANKTA